MDDGLAQHTLALTMNKDDFQSLLVFIFRHRLTEHIELIVQDIGSIHARRRLKHLVSMQVDDECAVILLAFLLTFVRHNLLVLIHLLLQSLGVNHQGACHLVVVNNGEEE